jgi:thioredoxin-like negative regulator of GroEL
MFCVRRVACTLALAAVSMPNGAAAPFDIKWETRLEPAAIASRETGKPILVEFWATWCEACKGMDEEVYSESAVARAMTKTVPVRIDIDRAPSIARRYEVAATPTFVLIDAAGNELFRFTGRIERAPLLELLRELPANITRINRLATALAADKSSLPTLEAMAGELRRASLYVASNRYYERAVQSEAARRDKGTRGRLFASVGENYLDLKRPNEAADAFEKAVRELRGLPDESRVMLEFARAQIAAGKEKDARRTLEEVQSRFKGTPAAAEAAKLKLEVRG